MKLRKKIAISLALTLLIALLAGCAQSAAPSATPAPAPAQPPASTPAAPAPAAPSAPAFAKQEISLGHVFAVDHVFTKAIDTFGERVSAATGGAVTVANFPANQLGEERDIVNGLTEGSISMAITANGEFAKRVKAFAICDAPYVFRDAQHMKAVFDSDVFAPYFKQLETEFKIRTITSDFLLGSRHLTTSKKPVHNPAEVKGMKIRVPDQPPSVRAWQILGANPTPVPFGELYLALQQGVAEGQENSFGQILGAKLQEVQKYLMLTGHVVQNNHITVSELVYGKMSPALQKIIVDEGKKIGKETFDKVVDLEKNVQLKQLQDAGMEVAEVDKEAFMKLAAEKIPTDGYFDAALYAKIQQFK